MEAPLNRLALQQSNGSLSHESALSHEDGCSILERFASLLGTKGPNQDIVSSSSRMKELSSLLSSSVSDDDVVLTVPSLDLRLTENEQGKSGVLPEVGAHSAISAASDKGMELRPNMAASVLSVASDEQTDIELKAAQNIGKRTSWTRSTLGYASGAVGINVSDSFTTLLNSRLRAWTLLLLRHSLSTGSGESRSRLLSMLAADIQVKSIETEFKPLPLPDAAKGAKPKDSDIILPLLFQVTLNTTIQDQPEIVTLRAPGTISAIFDCGTGLKRVNVQLDTRVVLKSMLDQARISVMKAVATATDTSVASISDVFQKNSGTSKLTPIPESPTPTTGTGSYNSPGAGTKRPALGLSSTDEVSRLNKARSSALRLNNVLHGRSLVGSNSSNTLGRGPEIVGGIREVRSVRFDHMIRAPKLTSELKPTPNPENKLRMAQTANKLKSYKSFGRPHAGDFGTGPRNATFGEFGFAGAWGRDGRLAAHPTPGQASAFDDMNNLSGGSVDKNATFDNVLSGRSTSNAGNMFRSSAAASGAALLGRTPSLPTEGSIPRTATAMESMLMKKWT